MEGKSKIKQYNKGSLTINWEPAKCIHSGICVRSLPRVYNPNSRPWIKPENASIEDLKAQIDKCPSGALTYDHNEIITAAESEIYVEIKDNGPLLIKGKVLVSHPSGNVEQHDKITAFCRCGGSQNKPYCDGAHRKIDFKG